MTEPNRPSSNCSTPNTTPRSRPTRLAPHDGQPPSHFHHQHPPARQRTHPFLSNSPPSSKRMNSYPVPRVTIPSRILPHVPSPISTPVSALYQSYQFQPVIEDEDDEATSGGNKRFPVIVEDNSPAVSPVDATFNTSASHLKRKRPHPRLSILLTPPLSATGTHGAASPPPTPILAVLEEGYHQCLRAVLKQDALVRQPASCARQPFSNHPHTRLRQLTTPGTSASLLLGFTVRKANRARKGRTEMCGSGD